MEGTEIVMPNDVLSLAIGMGSKLIIAFVLNHPKHTQQEVADMLGTSRRNVAKAVALAKSECEHLFTQCEQLFTEKRTSVHTPLKKERNKEKGETIPTPTARKLPDFSEVKVFAASEGHSDLAEEFFSHNSEAEWMTKTGEPITSWKGWFRGWAKNKKSATTTGKKNKSKANTISMEDMRYMSDYETQTRNKK